MFTYGDKRTSCPGASQVCLVARPSVLRRAAGYVGGRVMKLLLTAVAGILLLQGCVPVYVPPVWDVGDEIHSADQIVEGVTTRTEVVERLGEPHWQQEQVVSYSGYTSAGWYMIASYGAGTSGLIDEEGWWVSIELDESDYVANLATSGDPWRDPKSRAELEKEALRGNVKAQYHLGRTASMRDILGAQQLDWICRSAIGGYPLARYRLGLYFETLGEPGHQQAFIWQSLASRTGLPAASAAELRLTAKAQPAEIERAKGSLAGWAPDQSYCERIIRPVLEQEARTKARKEAEEAARLAIDQEDKLHSSRLGAPAASTGASAAEDQYRRGQHFYKQSYALEGEWRELARQEAWYWTCLSAHHGQPQGQYLLGFWLSQDASSQRIASGPRDEKQAYVWYSRAAAQGLKVAQTAKADAKEDMNSTMIAEAELLVQTWQPDPASCGEPPTRSAAGS